jgi:tetratricopeptide (TPR) repeat protein
MDAELTRKALEVFERALDQPDAARMAWLHAHHGDDPQLITEVKRMLDADAAAALAFPTEGPVLDQARRPPPERVGQYRIAGLLGEGGMGEVYLGQRDDGLFEHEAAIKLVRPMALQAIAIAQFEAERRTLARLTHRYIAQLFDGGVTEDGSPYFIMERVRGAPINAYVEQHELSLKAAVELMVKVCDAVQYAHQHLVVHADLKPSNILVNEAADPKIVDFGVSGALSASTTAAERPLGVTPAYSSPERMAGAAPAPAEDVYSLGVVLRQLVTGANPAAAGWDAPLADLIAKAAGRGEAWRRERIGAVKGDLGRIIARATAREKAARYSSVESLRNDLAAWAALRPIAEMRGDRLHSLRLLFRRRTLRFVFAGAAAAGVLVALAVSTLLYLRAEEERQAADRRYGEVRELATFMMFDLYDELGKVAGNTQALELIADRSLGYLESLRDDATAPVEVKVEAAAGYQRLADVLGNPHGPNLGERATATGMLDEAVAVLEGLYQRNPNNRDVMLRLGEAAFSAATNAYVSDDDNEKARKLGLRAAEVYARLAARADGTVDDRRNEQRARIVAAATLPWVGKAADGIVELQDIRAKTAELLKQYPDNPDVEQFLGSTNVELARATVRLREGTGSGGDALAYWDEAVRVREKGWARNPQDTRTYRTLATILNERGAERRAMEQYDGALADMKRAEAIALDLLGRDASDKGLKRLLGGIRDETAKTLAYAGRGAEAVAELPVALAQSEAEIAEAPDNAGVAREYAYSLSLYADVYLMAGRKADACAMGRKARAAWEHAGSLQALSPHDARLSAEALEPALAACEG